MRAAVIGLGYVGAVTAAGLAARGHEVVGVDVDEAKVAQLSAGHSPVVEPGLNELIADGVASGRLRATTQVVEAMEQAEVCLVCVGTPSGAHGETDLSHVERALAGVRDALAVASPPLGGLLSVVVRSTVPPGTGDQVVAPIFDDAVADGWEVATAMCPEFLREGCGVADFYDPPFLVVGTEHPGARVQLEQLFAFLDLPAHQVDVRTAEALKYACNAFHATKVVFANEVARVFRSYGVDARRVMEIFCEDHKLNIAPAYLRPGFAFGGSCLPKDLRSLHHMARESDVDVPLMFATTTSNELVVREVVDRVVASGRCRVGMLGLSFKADTDDVRESPSVDLAERLVGKGYDVRIYDPVLVPEDLVGENRAHLTSRLPHLSRLLAPTPESALAGADVALVSTAARPAVEALLAADPAVVLDLHGALGAEVEALAGYRGTGW
ncbi:GDP-mannose 6-dehydrogenase [Nocardioides salarius]|uniref:UDP-glucose 6-dehydrogenase n=1 Tax=Nocardioides salarius TaxID=374513 RepID=A0ABS2ME12_9ACTN|nr:nucleotide sugar dehydrogenase [Nocardioides salarius]MBM7509426.1 GDP-mannose 6-dehydrogenase [Nocardioides salarius]